MMRIPDEDERRETRVVYDEVLLGVLSDWEAEDGNKRRRRGETSVQTTKFTKGGV